jgi:hypothetical protein
LVSLYSWSVAPCPRWQCDGPHTALLIGVVLRKTPGRLEEARGSSAKSPICRIDGLAASWSTLAGERLAHRSQIKPLYDDHHQQPQQQPMDRRNRALSLAVGTLVALLIAVGMFILLVSQQSPT